MDLYRFIVDLPIKHGDVPWFFVCLPEGIYLVGGLEHGFCDFPYIGNSNPN